MKYIKPTKSNKDKIYGLRELTINYKLVMGSMEVRVDAKALKDYIEKSSKFIYYPEKRLVHIIGSNYTIEVQLTWNGYAPRFTYTKD